MTTVLRTGVAHSSSVHGKYLLHEGMNRNVKRLLGKKKKGPTRRSPGLKSSEYSPKLFSVILDVVI